MDVFMFPMVNVTLFPRTTKPLPIFEPRYIEMFRRSLSSQTPIAVGFNDNPNAAQNLEIGEKVPFVREIAGFGHAQIVEERGNGTILAFLHGQGKVRLGPVKEVQPHIICEAEIITENHEIREDAQPAIQGLNNILARWIQNHIPDAAQKEVFMKNLTGPQEIIGAFASYLVKDYDFQQMILELSDINDKIAYLHRLAESAEVSL